LLKNENAQIRKETLERLVQMPLGLTDDKMFHALAGMLEDVDVNMGFLAAKALLSIYLSTRISDLVNTFSKVNRPKSFAAVINAFQNCN